MGRPPVAFVARPVSDSPRRQTLTGAPPAAPVGPSTGDFALTIPNFARGRRWGEKSSSARGSCVTRTHLSPILLDPKNIETRKYFGVHCPFFAGP
jgi:hypothetical protein